MDAIPLLPQPTLRQYTALAEELREVRADGSDAAADWSRRWLDTLILACGHGHTPAAAVLLDHRVDIEAGNGRAMRLAREYGHDATVAMLRGRGAAARHR